MLTKYQCAEICKQHGDDWDSTLPDDREFITTVMQAAYRKAIEDAVKACIEAPGWEYTSCITEIRKLGEVE